MGICPSSAFWLFFADGWASIRQDNRKGGSEMNHDEYWKEVMNRSEKTLCWLFEGQPH